MCIYKIQIDFILISSKLFLLYFKYKKITYSHRLFFPDFLIGGGGGGATFIWTGAGGNGTAKQESSSDFEPPSSEALDFCQVSSEDAVNYNEKKNQ